MEPDQFIQLVADMRRHQKDYFRNRSSLSLEAAKKAEKEVDLEIEKQNGAKSNKIEETPHPTLF